MGTLRRGVLLPTYWDENRFQLRNFNTSAIGTTKSVNEDQLNTNQTDISDVSTDSNEINGNVSETTPYANDKNEGHGKEGIREEEVDFAYATSNISDNTTTNSSEVKGGDECPICCKRLILLRNHMRTVHKIYDLSSYMYKCNKCKRNVFNAEGHELKCSLTAPDKPRISCPVCNTSLLRTGWADHARTVHKMKKKRCLKCNKDVYYHTHHIEKCSGNADSNPRITCPVCSASYGRSSFPHHARKVHKMKTQKCPNCRHLTYLLDDHLTRCQSVTNNVQLPASTSAAESMSEYERLREQRILEIKEEFQRLGLQKDVEELKKRKDNIKNVKATGKNRSTAAVPLSD